MRQYVVDAFADRIFEGNPAAVCVMERWPEEDLMLKITRENNLSETAFVVKEGEEYRLRWFTPGGEIDLCGHATLAAAHIITRFVEPGVERVGFQTLSGLLTVRAEGELLSMDFPRLPAEAAGGDGGDHPGPGGAAVGGLAGPGPAVRL